AAYRGGRRAASFRGEPRVVIAQAPLHFWRRGEGAPLLLVHGFAGHGESWADVAARFPSKRTVASLTLPGHDPACPAAKGARFEETLDLIASILKDSVETPFEAAGYSMGGRVLLGLLVRHPRLVSSATLIGANPGIESEEERGGRAKWDEDWARLLEERGTLEFASRWEALPIFATQETLPEEAKRRQRAIRLRHDPRALASALRSLGLSAMPDYRPELSRIAQPVRLVAGEKDSKFLAIARRMEKEIPRAELVVVPGAGHNVPLENPAFLAALFA
ncbi:MAG: alpha/beta fold hydrolase, partial [Candidatus Eisenbacteria bacterium]